MSASMYQISVPVLVKQLTGLATCLKKAQAHYAEKKYDEASLISSRLFPDMFTFARQVQVATDQAKSCPSLLAGVETPKYEDSEKTLAELIARVEKTIAYLKTFKPAQIDGSEEKSVTVGMPGREVTMKGLELVLNRNMPNFYFHCTTAYNILRHNGVEVGKRDFLGVS
jgi:hypothetical protein